MATRILVADDHHIMRQGLKSLLETDANNEIVGEAEDGRQAVEMVQRLRPDVVIMDVAMPTLNGVEATRRILQDNPHVKVIALSMHSDRQFVGRMLEAGASGYLLKDCAFEELADAVKAVVKGDTYLCTKVVGTVVDGYVRGPGDDGKAALSKLTNREREVLQLISEGHSTKTIAFSLTVSVKTIETHRRNIMAKLDVHSVAELTKLAVRLGLTSLED